MPPLDRRDGGERRRGRALQPLEHRALDAGTLQRLADLLALFGASGSLLGALGGALGWAEEHSPPLIGRLLLGASEGALEAPQTSADVVEGLEGRRCRGSGRWGRWVGSLVGCALLLGGLEEADLGSFPLGARAHRRAEERDALARGGRPLLRGRAQGPVPALLEVACQRAMLGLLALLRLLRVVGGLLLVPRTLRHGPSQVHAHART